jgi:predicted flap endonuclease-1-like 5' DNA nuclease
MATNLLWFVLAGFLLGFATSTLWEWFYFRKERLKLTDRRIRELEAKLLELETTPDSATPTLSIAPSATAASTLPTSAPLKSAPLTSAWNEPAYRSPGVFLETEEYAPDGESSATGRDRPLAPAPSRSSTPAASTSVSTSAPIAASPAEPAITPRSEQSPADALRARRGDSPRSRQEVLAALRRNSNPELRAQAVRAEAEAPQVERPTVNFPSVEPLAPEPVRTPLPRESTLVTPTPLPASPTTGQPSATAQLSEMTPVRQRWANNPELTRRSQEYPDDLSKIKGIGDVYKQRLYRAGIYTWKQIAEGDIETLRRATSAYPSSNVDEWLVQAQKLIEKHGRSDAVYNGPQPDDMTKILGIGPVSAAALYRAGICTYEQLASTPIADLEALFPIAVAGDQPDFAQWVTRAANLADEKHRDE